MIIHACVIIRMFNNFALLNIIKFGYITVSHIVSRTNRESSNIPLLRVKVTRYDGKGDFPLAAAVMLMCVRTRLLTNNLSPPFFTPLEPPTILPPFSFLLNRVACSTALFIPQTYPQAICACKRKRKKRLASNGYGVAREYCSCKSPYRSTNGGSFIIIVDVPTGARYRRIFHLVSSSLCPCPSGMSFYSSILLVVVFVYVDVTGFQRGNDIKRTRPRSGTTCRLVSPLPVIINRERVFQGPPRAVSSLWEAPNWKNCILVEETNDIPARFIRRWVSVKAFRGELCSTGKVIVVG